MAKTTASSEQFCLFTTKIWHGKHICTHTQHKELALSCTVGSLKVQINAFNKCSAYKTFSQQFLAIVDHFNLQNVTS
jgi:hypothetical protein